MIHVASCLALAVSARAADPSCRPDTAGAWPFIDQPPGFFASSDIMCSPSDSMDQPKTCSRGETKAK